MVIERTGEQKPEYKPNNVGKKLSPSVYLKRAFLALSLGAAGASAIYWHNLWSHSEPVKASVKNWDYRVFDDGEEYLLLGNYQREPDQFVMVSLAAIYSGTDIKMGGAVADWADDAPGWRDASFAVYYKKGSGGKFNQVYRALQKVWLPIKYRDVVPRKP